jgi:hypothetical protein
MSLQTNILLTVFFTGAAFPGYVAWCHVRQDVFL